MNFVLYCLLLYTRKQSVVRLLLHSLEAKYRTLLDVTLPGWYSGRSGRMKKADTFRKNALRSTIIIDLRRGKVPSKLTQEVMDIGALDQMSDAEKKKQRMAEMSAAMGRREKPTRSNRQRG